MHQLINQTAKKYYKASEVKSLIKIFIFAINKI